MVILSEWSPFLCIFARTNRIRATPTINGQLILCYQKPPLHVSQQVPDLTLNFQGFYCNISYSVCCYLTRRVTRRKTNFQHSSKEHVNIPTTIPINSTNNTYHNHGDYINEMTSEEVWCTVTCVRWRSTQLFHNFIR